MEIKLVDLFLDEDFWEFNIVQYWGEGDNWWREIPSITNMCA